MRGNVGSLLSHNSTKWALTREEQTEGLALRTIRAGGLALFCIVRRVSVCRSQDSKQVACDTGDVYCLLILYIRGAGDERDVAPAAKASYGTAAKQ